MGVPAVQLTKLCLSLKFSVRAARRKAGTENVFNYSTTTIQSPSAGATLPLPGSISYISLLHLFPRLSPIHCLRFVPRVILWEALTSSYRGFQLFINCSCLSFLENFFILSVSPSRLTRLAQSTVPTAQTRCPDKSCKKNLQVRQKLLLEQY